MYYALRVSLGIAMILCGMAVFCAETWRLVRQGPQAGKQNGAFIKILSIALKAPYPLIVALVGIAGGYWMLLRGEHAFSDRENEALRASALSATALADSLTIENAALRALAGTRDGETAGRHFVELRFGAATPVPFLGRGAIGMLQSTPDKHVDLMIFRGTNGYSVCAMPPFDRDKASSGIFFAVGSRFFLQGHDDKIWGVNVIAPMDKNTMLCEFFEP